jgi:MFS family permease
LSAGAHRGVVAGCALGVTSGWNFGNVGGIASELGRSYGVGLATIGLLTTAMVVTHVAVQIPGGKASDRFGPVRAGVVALLVLCAGNALALAAPEAALAIGARALIGIGTGLAFISGSALVRESGGSPLAQGIFGGIALAPGGVALAVVPQLEHATGWRTPYLTALVLAAGALALVLATRPGAAAAPRPAALGARPAIAPDGDLVRLAILYTASYGLGVVVANWVVELLQRHSSLSDGAAAAVGALTLLLVAVSRPFGGWLLSAHPQLTRPAVAASVLAGTLGTLALLASDPVWLAVLGSLLVGIGAGVPFAPAFTGAAAIRPQAPAAAVGAVNATANLAVLVGTPLVGLGFSAAGEGRLGFTAVAALWLAALAALPSGRALGVEAPAPARRAAQPASN